MSAAHDARVGVPGHVPHHERGAQVAQAAFLARYAS
jgi:hypothetical protein